MAEQAEWPQDDVYQYVVPFNGLNTKYDGRLVEVGEAPSAKQVWISDGTIRRALGRQQLGDTPWSGAGAETPGDLVMYREHETDGTITRRWLAVVKPNGGNPTLYELVGSSWTSRGTLGTTGPDQYDHVQYDNRMFFTNGVNKKVWNGSTLEDWWQGAPGALTSYATDPEDNDASGELFAGARYGFAYSLHCSATGEETTLSSTLWYTFVGAGSDNVAKVDFPVTSSVPARFDEAKIYRTRADIDGDGERRFERTISFDPSVGATDVAIGLVEDALLDLVGPRYNDEPPDGRAMWVWDDRMWMTVVKDAQTTLYFSERGEPLAWKSTNTVSLDREDGDPIKGGAVFQGRLYVFKRRQTYLIGLNQVTTYAARRLEGGRGLVHHRAIFAAEDFLFGFSDDSLWKFNGGIFEDLSEKYEGRVRTLTEGVEVDKPLHLIVDAGSERNRLLVSRSRLGASPITNHPDQDTMSIEMDGRAVDYGVFGQYIASGERDDGRIWLASLDSDDSNVLAAYEYYDDSSGDDIYETVVSGQWETGDLDVDPELSHKLFVGVEFVVRRPPVDGHLHWEVWYDARDTGDADEVGDLELFGVGDQRSRIIPVSLAGDYPAETIRIKLVLDDGQPRVLALRILWKRWGAATRL